MNNIESLNEVIEALLDEGGGLEVAVQKDNQGGRFVAMLRRHSDEDIACGYGVTPSAAIAAITSRLVEQIRSRIDSDQQKLKKFEGGGD